jgi:type I restriction enzyme M protein
MDYWNSTLQDDLYIIAQDGWKAIPYRIQETKKGKSVDKGWACDLIPKSLIVERYFKTQSDELTILELDLERLEAELESFTEEQNQEGGVFFTTEKVNKASANKLLKELKVLPDTDAEVANVSDYLKIVTKQAELKSKIKSSEASLDIMALKKYGDLTEADVKDILIRSKLFQSIQGTLEREIQELLSTLLIRVGEVEERYSNTLNEISLSVSSLEMIIEKHLSKFLS